MVLLKVITCVWGKQMSQLVLTSDTCVVDITVQTMRPEALLFLFTIDRLLVRRIIVFFIH